MIDYALWEVIENGNTAPKTTVVEGVEKVMPPITAEEKAQKRLEKRDLVGMQLRKSPRGIFQSRNMKTLLLQAQICLIKLLIGFRSLNKTDLDTMSMDDLYKNLKVYEPEVKGMSSSSSSTQNMAFVSSSNNNNGSTNRAVSTAQAVNTANEVFAINTQVNAANIDNLSDAVICAFLASQPNNPQLAHEDLQQIHPDDLEEMDLRWQMAILIMRARSPKWNATTATRGDILLKSVELQEIKTTRTRKAQEGLCLWKHTLPQLWCHVMVLVGMTRVIRQNFKKSELMVLAYKSGLKSVEEKLEVYKANKSIYSQNIKVLKFEIECKDIAIRELRKKLEIAQKEKDGIQFNVDKFENASKRLKKLIESQIVNNCKKGLGYNAVPLPYTGNFMPPTPDLSFTGLDGFVDKPVVENNDEEEDVSQTKTEKKTVRPSIAKIEFVKPKQQKKTARKTVKQVEKHRQNTHSPRGNQRNWNNMMSQRLGSNFEMFNKACYVCGSFDHLQVDCNYHHKQFQKQRMVKPVWNNAQRVNHQNFAKKTHPCAKKNMVPRAVLMKSGLMVNTVKDKNVNTVRPKAVVNDARPKAVVNAVKGNNDNVVKASACWGNPQMDLQDQGVIDSGCTRHMTGNMSYLIDYKEIDRGYVTFGGNPKGGKITGKVPRKNNMYSVDLKNIVPKGGLTCLFAKATSDESKLWHRRLGHLNFKTMNKLVKGNLVRGLPSKLFENDQTCVACQKGKQHRASCKSKTENSISLPLHLLHMDLFGPTFVKSLMKKMYCLVVTDDYSRFTWVFFLATKDETSGILKSFITGIENLVDHKVKVIRCDNGTEFKNREMNQFCEMKGILRQFSVARTPQQNGVAERRNRTLIEAARTMLADSKLPTTFWAEAVNTACYVQNRVLVVKPHNKTPYELFHGRTPTLSFMRPFGCPVTILNTIDHLGKFDGKADEGFFVGYSLNSKAFRVFNSRTRIVEENLHIRFSESTPNVVGSGPDWLFNIDALTRTINYEPIVAGTQSNGFAGTKASDNAGQARKETKPIKNYILLPLWLADLPYSQDPKSSQDDGSKPSSDDGKKVDEDDGAEADMNNLDTTIQVSPIPTTRIHKDHPLDQVIGDLQSATQTRKMSNNLEEHGFEEPKKVIHALKDPSWIEDMQEELLQFKLQEV
ncbi:putative ribonuclease H-like domain-containing protein [Tanacetum coccineum]